MPGYRSILVACVTVWLLAGCTSALRWSPESHVVRPGETVYSIAFRYGIDQRDLIAWNRLDSGALIFPGQRLRLSPAGSTTSRSRSTSPSRTSDSQAGRTTGKPTNQAGSTRNKTPSVASSSALKWRWPTRGTVIARYGSSTKTQSGMHIGGRRGQAIQAAAAGSVVYSGSGLPGYGQLLIIKHSAEFLSAYGHNQQLLVREGDRVAAGQSIARMGDGPGQRALLHFEIRQSGKPVDPLRYLPRP